MVQTLEDMPEKDDKDAWNTSHDLTGAIWVLELEEIFLHTFNVCVISNLVIMSMCYLYHWEG